MVVKLRLAKPGIRTLDGAWFILTISHLVFWCNQIYSNYVFQIPKHTKYLHKDVCVAPNRIKTKTDWKITMGIYDTHRTQVCKYLYCKLFWQSLSCQRFFTKFKYHIKFISKDVQNIQKIVTKLSSHNQTNQPHPPQHQIYHSLPWAFALQLVAVHAVN